MPTYNPEVGRSQVGQNIVYDEDLIFYYDMYNEYTSFKGKPTTNLLSEPNGFTTWDLSSVSQENVFAVPYKKLVENTSSSSSFALLNSSVTFGLDYTMSVYAKKSERSFVQLAPSTGFSQGSYANYDLDTGTITGSFPANAASMEYMKVGEHKGWWRCQYTATSNLTTTSGRILVAIVPDSTSTRLQSYASIAGYGIYLRDMQMEQSSFATPFVDGTRSNTQTIIDLTGNATATTGSTLIYNSDNSFSFAGDTGVGSQSYINLGDYDIPTQRTVEVWFKSSTSNQTGQYVGLVSKDASGNIGQLYLGSNQTNTNIRWGAVGIGEISYSATADLEDPSQYFHYVGTYDASGTDALKLYRNSVLVKTGSSTGTPTTNNNNLYIGTRVTNLQHAFEGDIPIVRIYSRALTAAEVRQNFIATRSKFGL